MINRPAPVADVDSDVLVTAAEDTRCADALGALRLHERVRLTMYTEFSDVSGAVRPHGDAAGGGMLLRHSICRLRQHLKDKYDSEDR